MQYAQRVFADHFNTIAGISHQPVNPQHNVQDDEDADDDDADLRTLYLSNLSEKVTEEILFELFIQAGPVQSVRIPKDNNGHQRSYGFVTFVHRCSAPYSLQLFEGVRLFGRDLNMRNRIPNGPTGNDNRLNNMIPNQMMHMPMVAQNSQNFFDPFLSLAMGAPRNFMSFDTFQQFASPTDALRSGSVGRNNSVNHRSDLRPRNDHNQNESYNAIGTDFNFELLSRLGANLRNPILSDEDRHFGGRDRDRDDRMRDVENPSKHPSRSNRSHNHTGPYNSLNRNRNNDWHRNNQRRDRR